MYEPFPVSGPEAVPERPPPPRPVQNAVWLMYAGAALEAISFIVALLTRSSLKKAILAAHPGYTAVQLHRAEVASTVVLAIGAVIAIGLWVWMAQANGRGLSWARVLSAVFFGINTLSLAVSLLARHSTASVAGHTVATMIVGIAIWLVGLAAIVLIFSKDSAPFYAKRPRYG
jgi:hypothetical protein